MTGMIRVADKPARTVCVDLIRPHLPKRWVLLDDDRAAGDDTRTRVRVAQQSIEPGGQGKRTIHKVTMKVTVTVPGDSVAAAETQLDDDLESCLHAFDAAGLPWTKAEKAIFTDENNRLGYSFLMTLFTNPSSESE